MLGTSQPIVKPSVAPVILKDWKRWGQPQGIVGLDLKNPLNNNISISIPMGGVTKNILIGPFVTTSSTGHSVATAPFGPVSSFNGTTNGIINTFTGSSSPITISARIFASGVGGGAVCALTGPSGGDNWWVHSLELSATSIFSNTAAGACYLGLISSTGYSAIAAADTMASHAGWTEAGNANAPTYTAPRKTLTAAWAAASFGSMSTSSAQSFAITGTGTVLGAFINIGGSSTIDNTTGYLS